MKQTFKTGYDFAPGNEEEALEYLSDHTIVITFNGGVIVSEF